MTSTASVCETQSGSASCDQGQKSATGVKAFASGILGLFGASSALSPTDSSTRDALTASVSSATTQLQDLKDSFTKTEQQMLKQTLEAMMNSMNTTQKIVNATFAGEIQDNQLSIISLFAFVCMIVLYMLTEK